MYLIQINLTILPNPIRIWDLKKGEFFALTESGRNLKGDWEIYCKISHTRCILFSNPEKPIYLTPRLVPSDTGYKVLENWDLIEDRTANE